MKKVLILILLSTIFMGVSGFGVPENNVYVYREQKMQLNASQKEIQEKSEGTLKSTFGSAELRAVSKDAFSKSLAEKLGDFLVHSISVVVKAVLGIFH